MGRYAIIRIRFFLRHFLSAFREAVPVFSGLFGAQVNILHYAFSLFNSTYTVATSKETEHIAHKNQCFKVFLGGIAV